MKKLLKPILFLMLMALIIFPAQAQRWKILRYEASLGLGTCNIFGDIGGSASQSNLYGLKDIQITSTRPSIVFGGRYKLQENMSLKLNLDFCMGGGSDVGSKNAERNYKFTSFLFEHSLQYEYYFIHEDRVQRSSAIYNKRGMMNNYSRVSAYVFGGLGGLLTLPKLTAPGFNPVKETRLGTNYTVTLPIGIGAKLVYSDHWSFNVELGYRYTLSDGLDGLTSVYSKANDIYWLTQITACYRIRTARNGLPDFMAGWFRIKPGR